MTGSEATAVDIICLLLLFLIPALMGIGHGRYDGEDHRLFPASFATLVLVAIVIATFWIRHHILALWITRAFCVLIALMAITVIVDVLQDRRKKQ
jgi:hypothetical protein